MIRLYICHRFDKYLIQAINREEVCIGNGCGGGNGGGGGKGPKVYYSCICMPYQNMVLIVPL